MEMTDKKSVAKKKLFQARIHEKDLAKFKLYCEAEGRSVTEVFLDFVKSCNKKVK